MVRLRSKPEDIQTINGVRRNLGGRDLSAEESPTGEPIPAGSTFEAPDAWYDCRRHWHFLVVVERAEADPPKPHHATTGPTWTGDELRDPPKPEPVGEKQAASVDLEALGYRQLQSMCKDLGISAGGSSTAMRLRIAEHTGN